MSVLIYINMTAYSSKTIKNLPLSQSIDAHWCDFIAKFEWLSVLLNLNISGPWMASVFFWALIVKFPNSLTNADWVTIPKNARWLANEYSTYLVVPPPITVTNTRQCWFCSMKTSVGRGNCDAQDRSQLECKIRHLMKHKQCSVHISITWHFFILPLVMCVFYFWRMGSLNREVTMPI